MYRSVIDRYENGISPTYIRLLELIAHGNDEPLVCAIVAQAAAQSAVASVRTSAASVMCGARMPAVLSGLLVKSCPL
jgi:hypothetical protein